MPFCKAEYTAEGDRPLIIVVGEIWYKTEKLIVNVFGTQKIEHVVDKALIFILAKNNLFEEISIETTNKFSSEEE